jgi:hypothetical protein
VKATIDTYGSTACSNAGIEDSMAEKTGNYISHLGSMKSNEIGGRFDLATS